MSELLVTAEADALNEHHVTFAERQRQIDEEKQREAEGLERQKKSTYKNFAQLNRDKIAHIIACANADKQAVRILLFIIEHMDKFNALLCSYKVFEEQLNISKPTITRAIKYLKEKGFISVYRSGTSNVYVLNDDLAWTNTGDKHKYCKFPANIILSATEQDNLTKAKFTNVKMMEEQQQDVQ